MITTFLKKGLAENMATFDFEILILKPYQTWSTSATVAGQQL